MVDPGVPQLDPDQRARARVQELSRIDFGACGVQLSAAGELNTPTC
jgi:hypothetical protein